MSQIKHDQERAAIEKAVHTRKYDNHHRIKSQKTKPHDLEEIHTQKEHTQHVARLD